MIWLSIIVNIIFLLVSLPTWCVATIVGWFMWYMTAGVGLDVFYKYQLVGFLLAFPTLANRKGNVGVGVAVAGVLGYFVGKNTAKM